MELHEVSAATDAQARKRRHRQLLFAWGTCGRRRARNLSRRETWSPWADQERGSRICGTRHSYQCRMSGPHLDTDGRPDGRGGSRRRSQGDGEEHPDGTGWPPRGDCDCCSVALQCCCKLHDWPVYLGGWRLHNALKEMRETMRGAVLYGPRDLRFEERETPKIIKPTDVVIRITATCVCGSDLWPYRGIQPIAQPTPMGHEYCGIVEEVGKEVRNIKRGQFVVGSFATSDNTCVICRQGYQSSCVQREFMSTAQASLVRVPLADGTLVATDDLPPKQLIPSLLATSDVLGTGWFAADAANVRPGSNVVVVGDGAVGLLAVLSAKQMGAERIIAMSRHGARQTLAREFGATDIVTERGDEGVARIVELTNGVGADSVLECVGTQE